MSLNSIDLIQKLWRDPSDFDKFMSDPKTYLIEEGEQIPDNVTVKAYADTISKRHFVLPAEGSQVPQEVKDVLGDDPLLKVMELARTNTTFKAKLLRDPKAAASELEINIPDNLTIHVLENTPNEVNLTVPVNPATAEFSDADLELVAGGKLSQGSSCSVGAASTGVACGAAGGAAAFFTFGAAAIAAGIVSAAAAGGTEIGSAVAAG